MVLELLGVDGLDRLPAAEVAPPLADLLLEKSFIITIRHRSGPLRKCYRPDAPQRLVHRLPLPALLGELCPGSGRDPVVLATAAALGDPPTRLHAAREIRARRH